MKCEKCGQPATRFYNMGGEMGQACSECFTEKFGIETRSDVLRKRGEAARGGGNGELDPQVP